jgi:hypothetical protein
VRCVTGSDVEDLRGAAELWADFPAEARPRPLVFTGPTLDGAGFSSDEAKVAFINGWIEIAPGIPPDAVTALRAAGPTTVRGSGSSILLHGAELITHSFRTDRGPRVLPAWRLLFREALGPMHAFVENDLAGVWSPPSMPARAFRPPGTGGEATLRNRLSVIYRFDGDPRIYTDYSRVRLLEGPTVVVVAPVPVDLGGPDLRLLYAEKRDVEFRLQQPLGNRVLVDSGGYPVTVTE